MADEEHLQQIQKFIDLLVEKQTKLNSYQESINRDINKLQSEFNQIVSAEELNNFESITSIDKENVQEPLDHQNAENEYKHLYSDASKEMESTFNLKGAKPTKVTNSPLDSLFPEKEDLEKFIGENLVNKIGILILIIGIGIGAKYSIDNNLISPVARIILGYIAGIGLLGVGIKLKEKYTNYSAVLVSGALAVFYFITYFAFSFYDLIPQLLAFSLMVLFTMFTVFAALKYKQQIIALIGLVGAYGVPFLLSKEPGNIEILFTYVALINVGILFLAFMKNWKLVFGSAFILTWLIFAAWFIDGPENNKLAFGFSFIFFIQFYTTFLAYKLIHKQAFEKLDIVFLLLNSFIFYGIGYSIIEQKYLGLYTLGVALIHFMVAFIIKSRKLFDKNLFNVVTGLVLVFITIAIPVQLKGNWITLVWALEAALIYTIGVRNKINFYQLISYPVMLLAIFSLIGDWFLGPDNYNTVNENGFVKFTPIFNISFISSMLVIASFAVINYQYFKFDNEDKPLKIRSKKFIFPASLILLTYFTFHIEINRFYETYTANALTSLGEGYNYLVSNIQDIYKDNMLLLYSFVFVIALSILTLKFIKNELLSNIIILAFALLIGKVVFNLYGLNERLFDQLNEPTTIPYSSRFMDLGFRYILYAFSFAGLYFVYQLIKKKINNAFNLKVFDLVFITVVLIFTSQELYNFLTIFNYEEPGKLGLTIYWGVFSLGLILYGFWKDKAHFRIAAMVLFALTLLKLFLYDITHLSTVAKTIVFVSLGVLLLIISFFYNKKKLNQTNDE